MGDFFPCFVRNARLVSQVHCLNVVYERGGGKSFVTWGEGAGVGGGVLIEWTSEERSCVLYTLSTTTKVPK